MRICSDNAFATARVVLAPVNWWTVKPPLSLNERYRLFPALAARGRYGLISSDVRTPVGTFALSLELISIPPSTLNAGRWVRGQRYKRHLQRTPSF